MLNTKFDFSLFKNKLDVSYLAKFRGISTRNLYNFDVRILDNTFESTKCFSQTLFSSV